MTLALKILVPEIEISLKHHRIPVTVDTKRAFLVGVKISQMLGVELADQTLMDLGFDPHLDPKLKMVRSLGK